MCKPVAKWLKQRQAQSKMDEDLTFFFVKSEDI